MPACVSLCVRFIPTLRVLACVSIPSCASDVIILASFSSLSSVCSSPHLSLFLYPPFWGRFYPIFFSFHLNPLLSTQHLHTVASPDLSFMSSILVGKTHLDLNLNHLVPQQPPLLPSSPSPPHSLSSLFSYSPSYPFFLFSLLPFFCLCKL